jgi:hypothetical protein
MTEVSPAQAASKDQNCAVFSIADIVDRVLGKTPPQLKEICRWIYSLACTAVYGANRTAFPPAFLVYTMPYLPDRFFEG